MELIWIICAISIIALLYGSVGHGGASGYLAVMTIAGLAPEVMKPTALTLNLFISFVATVAYMDRGFFRIKLFWPFACFSIPFAWIGGYTPVNPLYFNVLLAIMLLISACRLCLPFPQPENAKPPPFLISAPLAAMIGYVSGLIGIGGGVLLTPILLLCRWADAKTAAAVSAPFVFLNSAAGLLGFHAQANEIPSLWQTLAPAAVCAGLTGAVWGSRYANHTTIRRILAGVITIAVVKLLLPGN